MGEKKGYVHISKEKRLWVVFYYYPITDYYLWWVYFYFLKLSIKIKYDIKEFITLTHNIRNLKNYFKNYINTNLW